MKIIINRSSVSFLLLEEKNFLQRVDSERHLHDVLRKFFNRSTEVNLSFLADRADSSETRKSVEPGVYTLFTASQYSANTELPVRSIEPAYRQCFDEVVRTYMEDVNKISRNMGRFLEYKKTLYGYYKHEPRHGMNYILDLFLIYRKYAGKKMSVSEQRVFPFRFVELRL